MSKKHSANCLTKEDDRYPCTCGGVKEMDCTNQDSVVEAPEVDDVRAPTHYQVFPGIESIEIIARSMTQAEFRGFCMGNVLKYRLRAGKKSDQANIEKDLSKADFYKELFEEHKYKCHSLK